MSDLEKDPRVQAKIFRWPIQRKTVTDPLCLHDSGIFYAENRRTIECKNCGAILDPFDWIVRQARKDDQKQQTANEGVRLEQCLKWLLSNEGRLAISRDGTVTVALPKSSMVTRQYGSLLGRMVYAIEQAYRRGKGPTEVQIEGKPA